MTIGLLSNENLPRGLNWTLLSDSLFAEIEKISDAQRIAPPPLSVGALGEYWRSGTRSGRMDTLFSMQGRARPELPLFVMSKFARKARKAVFYVDPWAYTIEKIHFVDQLMGHDIAFIPYIEAHRALQAKKSSTKYVYLPFASDNDVFKDHGEDRDIDILWMGRRSEDLHQALLDLSERLGLNYQYRETTGFISDPRDLGKLAARSRYFVVTPPEAERSGGYSPLLMRYFEGLAAGCRLLGAKPGSGEFDELLPSSAILEVSPDGSDLADRFERDQTDEKAWEATRLAQSIVRSEHGWDARARTIVEYLR